MTYGDYPDLKGVKKILVVKLRQLGDVLLTGPVFKVLKNRFPKAKVDAYVYTESFPLLEGCGLLGYDRNWKKLGIFKRLKKEFALWAKIRKDGRGSGGFCSPYFRGENPSGIYAKRALAEKTLYACRETLSRT
jgi:hypothetical protein